MGIRATPRAKANPRPHSAEEELVQQGKALHFRLFQMNQPDKVDEPTRYDLVHDIVAYVGTEAFDTTLIYYKPVSYTHLTLPTIYSV